MPCSSDFVSESVRLSKIFIASVELGRAFPPAVAAGPGRRASDIRPTVQVKPLIPLVRRILLAQNLAYPSTCRNLPRTSPSLLQPLVECPEFYRMLDRRIPC